MNWDEFVEAATATSWIAYLGTADRAGTPHVSVVAPGYSTDTIWIATRRGSKKYRNLAANPSAGFHWPVGGDGPGELAARGTATVHGSDGARGRIWDSGFMPFDLSQFFGSRDNPELVFVEVAVDRARLMGADFERRIWRRDS